MGGAAVGFHKAKFSYDWGANYERNFIGGPRGMMQSGRSYGMMQGDSSFRGMMGGLDDRDFRSGHGVAGTILSIADSTLVIKDRNGKENSVAVTDKTLIKRGRDTVQSSDLKAGDTVVVMGQPDQNGLIDAILIRIFGTNGN